MQPLYHGSQQQDLTILEPAPSTLLDGQAAVFATVSRTAALCFIGRWSDEDIVHSVHGDRNHLQEVYPGAFEKFFKGKSGSIYTVNPDNFQSNFKGGDLGYERFSSMPVTPTQEEKIPDIWEALLQSEDIDLVHAKPAEPPAPLSMTKKDYLVYSFQNKLHHYKQWVLETFAVTRGGTGKEKPFIIRDDKGIPKAIGINGEEITITDAVKNEPIFTAQDELTLNPGDLPNVKEKVDTVYGVALINAYVICYAFGDKIPYVNNEPIDGKVIEGLVLPRFVDYPPEGTPRDPNSISVDEHLRSQEALSALAGFGSVFSPTASEATLVLPKEVLARRDELFALYKKELNNPIVLAKIDKELTGMVADILKKDSSAAFFISKKAINVAIKKSMISYGVETGFNPDSPTVILPSLQEGLDFNNMQAIADSARSGSHARGAMTALGGQSVKELYRVFQNSKVSEADCGSSVGLSITCHEDNKKKFVGRYYFGKSGVEVITKEIADKLVGTRVSLRSPYYCKTVAPYYCATCVGKRSAANPTGIHVEVSDVGTVFMYNEMKQMHGKSLATYKFNLHRALNP